MKKRFMEFLLLVICMTIGGLISIYLGQATDEFDVYNYHIYAPWAFFNGRITVDILPAGIRSYFNPILNIPYFLLIKYFNNLPLLVGFIQGFWWGAIVFCGYKTASLFEFEDEFTKYLFRFSAALMTGISPIILFLCGTVYIDLHVAVLILSGLYFYLKTIFKPCGSNFVIPIMLSGFLFGAVSGLKLTSNLMIAGIFLSSLFMIKHINKPFRVFLLTTAGFLSGFFIINGYWYFKVWTAFSNPFFPYFNNIFHSPFGSEKLIVNDSYVKVTLAGFVEKLIYPFSSYFNKDISFGSWLFKYNDICIPLGVFAVMFLFVRDWFYLKKEKSYNDKILMFMVLFTVFTYLIWLNTTPVIRYIVPVIVFNCILILYILYLISKKLDKKFIKILFFIVPLIVMLLCSKIDIGYGRKTFDYQVFETVKYKIADNAVVLLASQKTSYLIPFLNKNAKYVYMIVPEHVNISDGAFAYNNRTIDYYYSDYYAKYIKDLLKQNQKLYLIFNRKAFEKEFAIYEQSLIYYVGDKLSLRCSYVDSYSGICRIIGY